MNITLYKHMPGYEEGTQNIMYDLGIVITCNTALNCTHNEISSSECSKEHTQIYNKTPFEMTGLLL